MTNYEFVSEIISIIKEFDSPQQALEVVKATPAPNKLKRAKKRVMKYIRTYIYIKEHPQVL